MYVVLRELTLSAMEASSEVTLDVGVRYIENGAEDGLCRRAAYHEAINVG